MKKMKKMKNKKAGFIVSVELLLITTILVIGLIVGLVPVRNAVIAELSDTAAAIDAIEHSYSYEGVALAGQSAAAVGGSAFDDTVNDTQFSTAVVAPSTLLVPDPVAL